MLFVGILAAALIFPLPEAKAEQSQEIGVAITQVIEVKEKSWDEIVSEQLKRREEQLLEAARIKAVEEAKKAEQAKVVQTPKPAPKVAQKAPIVARIVSYANTYSPGYCTWFVASRRPVPSGWGNARNWLANARAAGFATGSVPRVGAIAWTGAGAMGHVGLVTGVNGSQVTITEMNYAGFGVVSSRVANASEFGYIY